MSTSRPQTPDDILTALEIKGTNKWKCSVKGCAWTSSVAETSNGNAIACIYHIFHKHGELLSTERGNTGKLELPRSERPVWIKYSGSFVCKKCLFVPQLSSNTKRHYLRFHMQRRREVQCPGCTISFANNQTNWSLHVNSCIVLSEKQDPAASLRQWDDQDKKFVLLNEQVASRPSSRRSSALHKRDLNKTFPYPRNPGERARVINNANGGALPPTGSPLSRRGYQPAPNFSASPATASPSAAHSFDQQATVSAAPYRSPYFDNVPASWSTAQNAALATQASHERSERAVRDSTPTVDPFEEFFNYPDSDPQNS